MGVEEQARRKLKNFWTTFCRRCKSLEDEYLSMFAFPKSQKNQTLFIIGYVLSGFPQIEIEVRLATFAFKLFSIPAIAGVPLLFYSIFSENLARLRKE